MPGATQTRSVVKPPSRWRAWLRALGFGLQMTLGVSMTLYGYHSYQVRTRLHDVLAQLDSTDPGWRLQDIEAARAVVPDAENSALRVLEVEKQLPSRTPNWIEDDFSEELQHLPPERRMSPEQLAHLRDCLDRVRVPLEEARGLSNMPRGRFPIVYARDPLATLLRGQQRTREVSRLLILDATACAEAGDAHTALSSCRAALNAARSLGDEPTAVSQLIRVACAISACKMTERVMAQAELDSDDLRELQVLFEEENNHPYWFIACRGERAIGSAALEAIESGAVPVSDLSDTGPDWHDLVIGVVIQDSVRAIHPQYFTYTARLQGVAELPPGKRTGVEQQIYHETNRKWFNGASQLLPAYPKLADAFSRCRAVLRCQASAIAVERYRQLHGDWPPSLDALTPDFLEVVPSDPFGDDSLLYHRVPDGVVVYSVGPDGVDDGGNVEKNVMEPGADLGVRLWDVAKRRQPPAPPVLPVPPR
jgi:hypothetical protein